MTEDEARAVAAVAAQCLTWSGWRRWEPVMRYGRLFTPGTDAVAELTVQKNAEVDLCWGMGGAAYFASLHRLADGTWDAWLTPSHVPPSSTYKRGEEPTELLTPAGVSYEMALAAIFRAMGDDMPTGFGLSYLDTRITPGLPGPAQA